MKGDIGHCERQTQFHNLFTEFNCSATFSHSINRIRTIGSTVVENMHNYLLVLFNFCVIYLAQLWYNG